MAEPVGENGWLDLVDEASRTAGNLEQRIAVVELYKRAITIEPWSKKLWMAKCEWVWSLYTDAQSGDAGWSEEEQMFGQEVFVLETALAEWEEGYQAIKYRINDSHELWNRWIAIELGLLSTAPERKSIVRTIFSERLQIPHATWETTFQMFSNFVTKYEPPEAYEETMINGRACGQIARELYDTREIQELNLKKAASSSQEGALELAMKEYLDWEVSQAKKKTKKGVPGSPLILCIALYERALCSTALSIDPATWEDYLVYLTNVSTNTPYTMLPVQLPPVPPVLLRATKHCPWSGKLWARALLRAEFEHQPFEELEKIKNAATSTKELDRDGMDGVVEFYIAWSGYLKRMTAIAGATDEHIDVAEMGLRTALEDVEQWGRRRFSGDWKGDPSFRVERIFIQYLTQRGAHDEARAKWKSLVKTHSSSYEFWQQYYVWEMTVRIPSAPPAVATSILVQALRQQTLDWPEKIMEIYVRHCENYEDVDALLKALNTVHFISKQVAARRQREAVEAAAAYAQQQPEVVAEPPVSKDVLSPATKRKREIDTTETTEEVSSKTKVQKLDHDVNLQEQHAKRDRENTSVLVSELPEVTQTKVRQYFKEFGHINNITAKHDANGGTVALIEFQTPQEAQSALLRNGKYFGDKQITVEPGTGLTLFVTNFPPTADDDYLQKIFKDCGEIFNIRWPSLKHNAHRRFCYISFRTREAAAAATQLDGQSLGDVHKLVAKYSDPANKKERDGAMAEGREIHVNSLDQTLNEDDVKDVFSKYGEVERVRMLKTYGGQSKGSCFVVFAKKEQATAALEMDKTKLKSRVLVVELSTGKNFKQTATVLGKASSASPGPDADGDTAMSPPSVSESHPNTHAQHAPSRTDNKTITLLNIPDTINVERVRALVEPHGEIVKLTLRLDHQGAIIEYADAASAGRAALALENHEIAPGRKLRTGGMKDLFEQKDEYRTDRIQVGQGAKKASGPAFIQPNAPVRRPAPSIRGGRGGLGQKKGLDYVAASAPKADATVDTAGSSADTGEKKAKSNADFKAMFVSGGKE